MMINISSILISHLGGVVTGGSGGQFGRGQAVPGGGAVPGSPVRQPGPALGPRGASSSSHPVSRGPALPANADLSYEKEIMLTTCMCLIFTRNGTEKTQEEAKGKHSSKCTFS